MRFGSTRPLELAQHRTRDSGALALDASGSVLCLGFDAQVNAGYLALVEETQDAPPGVDDRQLPEAIVQKVFGGGPEVIVRHERHGGHHDVGGERPRGVVTLRCSRFHARSWQLRLFLTRKGRTLDRPAAGTVEHAVEKLLLDRKRASAQATKTALEELSRLLDLE